MLVLSNVANLMILSTALFDLPEKVKLPFWLVVIGNITKDPKRNRELAFWYKGFEEHFFMWRDQTDPTLLVRHFDKNFRKFLV